MKKPKQPKEKNPKLAIFNEMAQADTKNRKFFDELEEEEQKTFKRGAYPVMRWASNISSGPLELQKYYVQSCNEQANKHFFDLGQHPKLQWLMLTTISPGMGKQRHQWQTFRGKGSRDPIANLLSQIYPDAKISDLETLSKQMSEDEVKRMLRDLGWEDKRIKEALK